MGGKEPFAAGMGFSGVSEAWPPAMTVHFPACSFSGVSKAWPCVWANGVRWTGVGSSDEATPALDTAGCQNVLRWPRWAVMDGTDQRRVPPLALALILEASALCPRTGG